MSSLNRLSLYLQHSVPDNIDIPANDILQNRVRSIWLMHAGDAALHSETMLFESGRLVAYCTGVAWANMIRHRAPTLIEIFRRESIRVNKIGVRMLFTDTPARRDRRQPMRISARSSSVIEHASETIENEKLRNALKKLSDSLA